MRLFIAIQFSDNILKTLQAAQNNLRNSGVSGNYTKRENLHLTLAFIGDYPDPDRVLEIMDTVPFDPFRISLSGFGTFRGIFWAGIRENNELKPYVKRLRHALADNDIPFDRKRFSPHITLMRKPVWQHALPEVTIPEQKMTVRHVSLMRSDRGKYAAFAASASFFCLQASISLLIASISSTTSSAVRGFTFSR